MKPDGRGARRRRGFRGGRGREEPAGTLAAIRPGEHAVIGRIEDATARAQALRFGMGAGSTVTCMTALPAGPLVLRSGRQEIAVGRALARRIEVERPMAV